MADAWMSKESILWLMPLALGGLVAPTLVWLAKRGRHRVAVLSAWTALTVLYGVVAGWASSLGWPDSRSTSGRR